MSKQKTTKTTGAASAAPPPNFNAGIAPIATFDEALGNDYLKLKLRHLLRLKGTPARKPRLLITGPSGSEKSTLANHFARALACLQPTGGGEPCGPCAHCQVFATRVRLNGLFSLGQVHYIPLNCRTETASEIKDQLDTIRFNGHPDVRLIHLEEASGLKDRQADEAVMGYLDSPNFEDAFFLLTAMDATGLDDQLKRRCEKAQTSPPDDIELAKYIAQRCHALGIKMPEKGQPLIRLARRCHLVPGQALTLLDGLALSGQPLTMAAADAYPFPTDDPWAVDFFYTTKRRGRR